MVTSKHHSRSFQKSTPSCYLQSLSCFVNNRNIEELITKIPDLNSCECAAYDLHMTRQEMHLRKHTSSSCKEGHSIHMEGKGFACLNLSSVDDVLHSLLLPLTLLFH